MVDLNAIQTWYRWCFKLQTHNDLTMITMIWCQDAMHGRRPYRINTPLQTDIHLFILFSFVLVANPSLGWTATFPIISFLGWRKFDAWYWLDGKMIWCFFCFCQALIIVMAGLRGLAVASLFRGLIAGLRGLGFSSWSYPWAHLMQYWMLDVMQK